MAPSFSKTERLTSRIPRQALEKFRFEHAKKPGGLRHRVF